MLRLSMRPAELARTRFALSPLVEMFRVITAVIRPPTSSRGAHQSRAVVRLMHDNRMHLLTGLLKKDGWLPDFITPPPERFAPDLDDELHRVATTAPARLVEEIALFTGDRVRHGFTGHPLSPALHRQLERGEEEFAQEIARELHVLWRHTFAPRWPAVRGRLEREISDRARLMAERGIGATLCSLHPDINWHQDTLSIRSPVNAAIAHAPAIIMIPTTTGSHLTAGVDPLTSHDTMLCYPLPPSPGARRAPTAARSLADVLGATRHALLLSLTEPRTTGDLAALHHLDPSTVSYHLTRLHRAGLLTRAREGHRVYYHRNQHAEALLHDPET